jgi:hypothetical protein
MLQVNLEKETNADMYNFVRIYSFNFPKERIMCYSEASKATDYHYLLDQRFQHKHTSAMLKSVGIGSPKNST